MVFPRTRKGTDQRTNPKPSAQKSEILSELRDFSLPSTLLSRAQLLPLCLALAGLSPPVVGAGSSAESPAAGTRLVVLVQHVTIQGHLSQHHLGHIVILPDDSKWFFPDHSETGVPREGIEPSNFHTSAGMRSEVELQLLDFFIRIKVDERVTNLGPPARSLLAPGLVESGQQTGQTNLVVDSTQAVHEPIAGNGTS